MAGYKHIERCIASHIAARYKRPVEIGIGSNPDAARLIREAGLTVRCTDIHEECRPDGLQFFKDDIFSPSVEFYQGADVIYAIRPAEEMIPPMILLAKHLQCDLLVYHLGFESFGEKGETIDCGVILHRYHRA